MQKETASTTNEYNKYIYKGREEILRKRKERTGRMGSRKQNILLRVSYVFCVLLLVMRVGKFPSIGMGFPGPTIAAWRLDEAFQSL